jgi:hypothetical protein
MAVRTTLLLVAVLALIVPNADAAERWVSFDSTPESAPSVSIVSSDLSGLVVRIDVPGIVAEEVETAGGIFTRLSLPGYGQTSVVGEALLPTIREFVELPHGATAEVRALDVDRATVPLSALGVGHPLLPVQPPVEKVPGALERAEFVLSQAYYAHDALHPEAFARVGESGVLRGRDFVQLEVNPIRYNPARNEIEFVTSAVIAVDFAGGDAAETRRLVDRYSNAYVGKLAADLFINHQAFESRYDIPLPIGYLIITHDNFYDEILPLAAWKHAKGHQTTVTRTSEIPGGSTKENIKAYIQDAYDTWPVPPTFVLLVGDTGYIPYWVGTQSSSPTTDLYYVTMDGSGDWDPDIWIGRFSCTTDAQVINLVEKTVDYERADWVNGTRFIPKAVFMASEDNWPVSEGTHNYVISTYLEPEGYWCQKLYSHTYDATTAQVSAAFNEGRSLGIYSGHGSINSWGDGPPFSASNVNALTNLDMYPLVHSYSCLTGQFSSACFGETWTNAVNKGAVVFWGSSVTSYWDEDDILEKRAFKAFIEEDYDTACGISHRALYWLYQHYGGGGSTRRYFEMYNILGDPGLDIWTHEPSTLTVSYPGQIPIGTTSLDVTVTDGGSPVESALVCVVKEDDGVYEAYYTNASGIASVAMSPAPAAPGALALTVTKHDYYPHEGEVLVSSANAAYCVFESQVIDDDSSGGSSGNGDGVADAGETIELLVTLENVGNEVAYGVSATLSTADSYVTVTDGYEEYGDIPISGTAQCQEDYDFDISWDCPDGHTVLFEVAATDDDTTWISQTSVVVSAPVLVVDDYVVDDSPGGGNGNGCVEAGETVSLTVTLANDGSSDIENVDATLSTTDPYVTILDDSASAAAVLAGSTATLTPEFTFLLDSGTPDHHEIVLDLSLSGAGGYLASAEISIMSGGGLSEQFEGSGTDWVHYAVTSGFADQWHVETYRSHSATHSWKFGGAGSGNYTDSADGALETPPVCIGSGGELAFWHWLYAEEESSTSAWDCALVEISTDGGSTWSVLVPVGGYSHVKNDNPANPLPPGTPCWSGYHDWREESFDLTAYEGANAIFRFRFASDGYVTEEGWYVDDVNVSSASTGVSEDLELLPAAFAVLQNTPNPFNPVTEIRYALPAPAWVEVRVYNVAGELVRTLRDGPEEAGFRSVVWDGRNDAGHPVASGVYLYSVTAGDRSDKRMMVLLK